jgi:hypothetical protein
MLIRARVKLTDYPLENDMRNRELDKLRLESMVDGAMTAVGYDGEVYRVNGMYVLFETSDAGKNSYEGTYHKSELDLLLDIAFSWT